MDLCGIFGTNVKRLRKQAGYSQEEFADLTGTARSYMSDLERSARNPTLKIVERIALALKVDPSELLKDSNGGPSA